MATRKSSELPSVSLTEFARLIQVSPSVVSEWTKQGMPSSGGGRQGRTASIKLEEALPWVVNKLRETSPEMDQRQRKAGVEADILAIKLAEKRGEIFDYQTISVVIGGMINAFTQELDSQGARLCRRLATIGDPGLIRQIIREDGRGIRTTLARTLEQLGESCQVLSELGGSASAGGRKGRSRVGKRKPKV